MLQVFLERKIFIISVELRSDFMNINTLKEFVFIAVFSIDVFFNVYFLYKFKKLPVKKISDYFFFASYCLVNIIKAIIIYNILRLKFDPIGFIYNPKMVYVGFEYHELFNMFKSNLLNNYIRVTAFMWGYFLIYYYFIHHKKVTEIEN